MRLEEFFLFEDSRGNIVRLLRFDRKWADFFHSRCGKLAFQVANWLAIVSRESSDHDIFQRPPGPEPESQITKMLLSLPCYTRYSDSVHGPSNPHDPIDSAVTALNASASLRQTLANRSLDANALKAVEVRAQEDRDKNVNVSGLGQEFLRLPNGFVWKTVSDEEFYAFAGPMMSCGDTAGDDQMFVLLDPKGRPHVVASYEKRSNSFDQIAGKANSVPEKRYRPMIDALLQSVGAKPRRGEKSFGSSFEGD